MPPPRHRTNAIARQLSITIAVLMPLVAGCGVDLPYLLHLSIGVLGSYSQTRPITDVLADGSVTPEQAVKLQFVLDVRAFARDRIGLNAGEAYTLFQDNSGVIAYALSASRKDRFEKYQWNFPIVGLFDTKGYFDLNWAQADADGLEQQGYDVFLGEVAGFSTLGVLPDPIRATNLLYEDVDLAELLMHELLHNTIFKPNDTDFNESMATFVGRAAAQRFFDEVFGADSPEAVAASRRFADSGVIDSYVVEVYQRMLDYYAQSISTEEILAGREAQFAQLRQLFTDAYQPLLNEPDRYDYVGGIATNNAIILAGIRYQAGLQLYQDVFNAVGQDFAALLDLLAAAAAESDSRTFLVNWLGSVASN